MAKDKKVEYGIVYILPNDSDERGELFGTEEEAKEFAKKIDREKFNGYRIMKIESHEEDGETIYDDDEIVVGSEDFDEIDESLKVKANVEDGHTIDEYRTKFGKLYDDGKLWDFSEKDLNDGAVDVNPEITYWKIDVDGEPRYFETCKDCVDEESLKEGKEDKLIAMIKDDKVSVGDCMHEYLTIYEDTDVMTSFDMKETIRDLNKGNEEEVEQAKRLEKLLDDNPGVDYFDYYNEEPITDKKWLMDRLELKEALHEADEDELSDDDLDALDAEEEKAFRQKQAERRARVAGKRKEKEDRKAKLDAILKEIGKEFTFEKLIDKLVPDTGKADTVAGELVRALHNIDAVDPFFVGEGLEHDGAYMAFIENFFEEESDGYENKVASEISDSILDVAGDFETYKEPKKYGEFLKKLEDDLVNYIKDHNELLVKPNEDDARIKFSGEKYWEDYIPTFDIEDCELPSELKEYLELEVIDANDIEWYVQDIIMGLEDSTRDVQVEDDTYVNVRDLSYNDYNALGGERATELYDYLEVYARDLEDEHGTPDDIRAKREEDESEEDETDESLKESKEEWECQNCHKHFPATDEGGRVETDLGFLCHDCIKELSRGGKLHFEDESLKEGEEKKEGFISGAEDLSYDELAELEKELFAELNKNGIHPEDGTFSNSSNELADLDLTLIIRGDWRHDHLATEEIVEKFVDEKGYVITRHMENTMEEDGSDYYTSEHKWYLIKDTDGNMKDTVAGFQRMFARPEDESLDEASAQLFVYQFPPLTKRDLKVATEEFGLEYLGKQGPDGFQPGDHCLRGTKKQLKKYCDEYLGYEMHPDYLCKAEDFNDEFLEALHEDKEYLSDKVTEVLDDYGILYGDIVENGDGSVNIVGVDEDEWDEVVEAIKAELGLDVIVPDADHGELDNELIVRESLHEDTNYPHEYDLWDKLEPLWRDGKVYFDICTKDGKDFLIIEGWDDVIAIEKALKPDFEPKDEYDTSVLDELDINWGFSDEYMVCDDCHHAIRTAPDSYSWVADYYWDENGIVCGDCVRENPEPYIAWLLESPSERANTILSRKDLENAGFHKVDGDYESGWYDRHDDPEDILAKAQEAHPEAEFIFNISGQGQFATQFELWMRGE